MTDMKIRPSNTLVIATYVLAVLLAGGITYLGRNSESKAWMTGFALPAIMIVSAAAKQIKSRFTTMEIAGDRLKYESGMASRVTRSVPLHKVQDVTVRQTFGQRLMGLGDLSIETAGETSRLTIEEIRSPKVIAERILDRVAQLDPNRK